jgi:hypothetical protein
VAYGGRLRLPISQTLGCAQVRPADGCGQHVSRESGRACQYVPRKIGARQVAINVRQDRRAVSRSDTPDECECSGEVWHQLLEQGTEDAGPRDKDHRVPDRAGCEETCRYLAQRLLDERRDGAERAARVPGWRDPPVVVVRDRRLGAKQHDLTRRAHVSRGVQDAGAKLRPIPHAMIRGRQDHDGLGIGLEHGRQGQQDAVGGAAVGGLDDH